jgi:hypothetical protein
LCTAPGAGRATEHLGSAHGEQALEALKVVARQRLAGGQGELEIGVDTGVVAAVGSGPLQIVSSRMAPLWEALCAPPIGDVRDRAVCVQQLCRRELDAVAGKVGHRQSHRALEQPHEVSGREVQSRHARRRPPMRSSTVGIPGLLSHSAPSRVHVYEP